VATEAATIGELLVELVIAAEAAAEVIFAGGVYENRRFHAILRQSGSGAPLPPLNTERKRFAGQKR
jgi:hypothetical protein